MARLPRTETPHRSSMQVTRKRPITPGAILKMNGPGGCEELVVVVPKPVNFSEFGVINWPVNECFFYVKKRELMSGTDPRVNRRFYTDAGIIPYDHCWNDSNWTEKVGQLSCLPKQVSY